MAPILELSQKSIRSNDLFGAKTEVMKGRNIKMRFMSQSRQLTVFRNGSPNRIIYQKSDRMQEYRHGTLRRSHARLSVVEPTTIPSWAA
jgi:hypothetical protein